ncbi:MAG: hypothetical protein EGQ67_00315 [Clostridiales bacterium]|nr:hypothetical protein [Clostridiales bacterium]
MLSQKAKDLFAKLEMDYPAVAIKYSYAMPENTTHTDKTLSFCEFVKEAQVTGKKFFITKDDDNCFGKMALGMIPKPPLGASGQAGYDFGVFKTPAPNARIYNSMTTLVPGSVNFVIFSPVAICDFDPDLIICVAEVEKAEIIMRATSYISGDFWESKCSSVLSCAWMYSYPYVSGKVNFCITGMHHGMKRRGTYPPGRHIIAIPYQKINEVVQALDEMDWELIAMRKDDASKAELARRMAHWQEMSPDFVLKK